MTTKLDKKSVPTDLLVLVDELQVVFPDEKFFLVGGAVRDMVLGVTPKDFDVASAVLPDALLDAVRSLPTSYKVLEVGKSFGVVVVLTEEGGEYEFATFREDLGEGRRPDGGVRFATIETDVMRRDLTMNALFMDMSTFEVVDLVGGLKDLAERRVRCVGLASERFREDPLRVLRAVRFAARFDGLLDEAAAVAALDELERGEGTLVGVSAERVRDEFLKGLATSHSVRAFLGMLETLGLLRVVFPGCDLMRVEDLLLFSRDPAVMVALLLQKEKLSSGQVGSKLNKLKWSAQEVAQVVFFLDLLVPVTAARAPRLRKRQLTQVHASRKQFEALSEFVSDFERFMAFLEKPVEVPSSESLMALGFTGKALGEELARLEALTF